MQKAIRLLRNEGSPARGPGRDTHVTWSANFENVARDIRQQIYSGMLAPGAKLPAREVLAYVGLRRGSNGQLSHNYAQIIATRGRTAISR